MSGDVKFQILSTVRRFCVVRDIGYIQEALSDHRIHAIALIVATVLLMGGHGWAFASVCIFAMRSGSGFSWSRIAMMSAIVRGGATKSLDCASAQPASRRRFLALFGPHAMSDLSPGCVPKRTFADHSEFMGSHPSHLVFCHNQSSSCACYTGGFVNDQLNLLNLTFGGCLSAGSLKAHPSTEYPSVSDWNARSTSAAFD